MPALPTPQSVSPEVGVPFAATGNTFYTYMSSPETSETVMEATIARANADPLNTYVILMAAGTYSFFSPIPTIINKFTIRGNVVIRGMNDTFTDAGQARFERIPGQPSYRFFNIRPEGSLTLYNVFMKGGGGVGSGGAIFNRGILNLYNTTFEANSATVQGGALHTNDTGITRMANVIFRSNSAPRGGAISNNGATVTNYFGGNYCLVFRGNSATTSGGAVYNPSGITNVNRGIYRENTAPVYRDIENQAVTSVDATSSWWQVPPSVSSTVITAGSIIGGTIPNLNCAVTTPPAAIRAIDYGLVFNGNWTPAERVAVLNSAARIAEAFTLQVSTVVVPHVIFKRVMGVANGAVIDQGNITLIRVTSQSFCNADNNNRTITCGNLQDSSGNTRLISEFVITHEFGHIFDNQSARGGNKALRSYIADTATSSANAISDVRGPVMGIFINSNNITVWRRGERGWGTGPGSIYNQNNDIDGTPTTKLFSDFQQNTAPYASQLIANEETAADMFLNWVYRKSGRQNGFVNKSWKPNDFTPFAPTLRCNNPSGCAETNPAQPNVTLLGNSGDSRFNWMSARIGQIFVNRGWNN